MLSRASVVTGENGSVSALTSRVVLFSGHVVCYEENAVCWRTQREKHCMKLRALSAAFAVAVVMSTPQNASARPGHEGWGWGSHPSPHSVPELNMKGASSAVALILGGILVLAGRRKRDHG